MNKKSVVLLAIGLVVILALGIFFIMNMPGRDDSASDNPSVNDPLGPGEPSQVPPPQTAGEEQPTGGPRVDEGDNPEDPHDGHDHQLAPDFTLKNLEGEDVSLSDYKGKYVFLNIWASWCPPCVQEMPDFQKYYEANEDLVILAVNYKEEYEIVKNFVEDGGFTFPVVLDSTGEVSENSIYQGTGIPRTYFIDREGNLLAYYPGMLTPELMEEGLKLLRED